MKSVVSVAWLSAMAAMPLPALAHESQYDALVATHAGGRLPVDAFAATLRDLLATPLVKPPRLRKSFDAVGMTTHSSATVRV